MEQMSSVHMSMGEIPPTADRDAQTRTTWYQVPGGSAFQKKRDAFAWLDGNVIKENSVNLNVFRHLSTYKHKCPSTALHNNRDVW